MMDASGKGVVFDLDGVLVDTSAFHKQSWYDLAAKEGWHFDDDLFLRTFGMQSKTIVPLMTEQRLSVEQITQADLWKEQHYRELIAGKVQLLPGAESLIEALTSKGFLLAVGSSAPRLNIEMLLTQTDICGKFHVLVSREDISQSKPAPDTFLQAAAKLALPPSRCVVVEDAVQGVQAAKAAGMAVVAVTNTRTRNDLIAADRVVDSLTELTTQDFQALLETVAR